MSETIKESGLWFNALPSLEYYNFLEDRFASGDTKALYIVSMASKLSLVLPEQHVYNEPVYISTEKSQPLPKDVYKLLDMMEFHNWLMCFQQIMRKYKMIGGGGSQDFAMALDPLAAFIGHNDSGMDVNYNALMASIFKEGQNHVYEGTRGGGKTHTALAYAEAIVKGEFPGIPKTYLITNIPFGMKTESGDFVPGTPKGVYQIRTMEQMFRYMAKKMIEALKKKEEIMFEILLDEVQNFLLAEENYEDTNQAFLKFYGTIRKFHACLGLITPSIENLAKKSRHFEDGSPSGYVSAIWSKDRVRAREYIRRMQLNDHERQYITLRISAKQKEPYLFKVPRTSWTMTPEELKPGEYCYDHRASADLEIGEGFDFKKFIEHCSGKLYNEIPYAMQEYFDKKDSEVEEQSEENESMERVHRGRTAEPPLTWKQIAAMEGPDVPENTWKSRYTTWKNRKKTPTKRTELPEFSKKTSSAETDASVSDDDLSMDAKRNLYIDNLTDSDIGPSEGDPSSSGPASEALDLTKDTTTIDDQTEGGSV